MYRNIARMALAGLSAPRKTLPPSLFYDEEGCRLFYRITELPEYYLTRVERGILAEVGPTVAGMMGPGATLVEYGASHEEKASFLLNSDGAFGRYLPIDVAAPALMEMQGRMASQFPGLTVTPVVADFMRPVALPGPVPGTSVLGFFPGSTIGNLEPSDAVAFFQRARESLGPGARFLLGADLRKPSKFLLPAYNDAQGVTAAFNRNLLVRLNREANASFDPSTFRHEARWNDAESRIEMHLVSVRPQTISVAGADVHFLEGETIHTENSYKHAPDRVVRLAGAGGWSLRQEWTDPAGWFGHFLFEGA